MIIDSHPHILPDKIASKVLEMNDYEDWKEGIRYLKVDGAKRTKIYPLESPAACPVRSLASIGACSGDEPRKTSGLLPGEDKFLLKRTLLEIYL
jgi:hypothetical protein